MTPFDHAHLPFRPRAFLRAEPAIRFDNVFPIAESGSDSALQSTAAGQSRTVNTGAEVTGYAPLNGTIKSQVRRYPEIKRVDASFAAELRRKK